MREQWTQAAEKPKRKWWKPSGPAKIAIAVLLTLLLSTGLWCLALGPSGIAMVQTYLLARFAFVEPDADLEEANLNISYLYFYFNKKVFQKTFSLSK